MSNNDSFIDEVSEEVRRERLYGTLRRYGWIGVLAVLLLVGGASWREYSEFKSRQSAEATGDAILAALEAEDAAARLELISAVPVESPEVGAMVAMLQVDLAEDGAQDAAIAQLVGASNNPDIPPIYREMAAFKALGLQANSLSDDELKAGYEGLGQPGQPFWLLAQEQLAQIDVRQGDTAGALDRLNTIISDAGATSGLQSRARQLIVALGGTPEDFVEPVE